MLPALRDGLETLALEVSGVNNFHYLELPDNVSYPYQYMTEPSKARTSMDGGTWQHEARVQFTLVDIDRKQLEDTSEAFVDKFENNVSGLSVSGWTVLALQSALGVPGIQRFGDVYQDVLQYDVRIIKDK